jgi:hypothetical protein
MASQKSLVLAVVAVRDKLELLRKRILEYEDHLRKANTSEESKEFWTHQLSYVENLIQEYRAAETDLLNS